MKTLNLFLKMHFTSLSPDGQYISMAIVSEEHFDESYRYLYTDKVAIKKGNCSIDHLVTKSFYAEFSDFDLNMCDDWVKENVISKLTVPNKNKGNASVIDQNNNPTVVGNKEWVKDHLNMWISQFSDYKINFIIDCGWFDWYKFVELIGEWEEKESDIDFTDDTFMEYKNYRVGIPKLPANFPPIPQDLNELIAFKKNISISEAFDIDRESYLYDNVIGKNFSDKELRDKLWDNKSDKHNALWDARITKEIYYNLNK